MAGGLIRRPRSLGLRRLALGALVLTVLAGHGWVTQKLAASMDELSLSQTRPARMEVAYVRDMALAPAPAAAAPAAPPAADPSRAPRARPASAPERAASQPGRTMVQRRELPPESPPAPTPERAPEPASDLAPAVAESPPPAPRADTAPPAVAAEPEHTAAPASAAESTAVAGLTAASAAASDSSRAGPPFEWPVSTRVSYRLTGNVRGEVNGDARVEWVRVGSRYQVHLDVTVGLSFAPLMTRSMSSDGDITPQGLAPRRYDQDTKVGFGAHQQVAVLFEPDAVVLATGQRRERWAGVQDTASQFIQLTYLFATRPELLRPGGALEVPLALPRNISRWVYDVLGEETVYTPFGPILAVHLKPRRAVVKSGDLSAETWFAPQLRYLPVRIRIQQDAETFIDLVIARKPELAAP